MAYRSMSFAGISNLLNVNSEKKFFVLLYIVLEPYKILCHIVCTCQIFFYPAVLRLGVHQLLFISPNEKSLNLNRRQI